nr:MAG TPA: hypothetical protein [Caudoviricetes sp.]
MAVFKENYSIWEKTYGIETVGADISQKGVETTGLVKSYMMQSLCWNVVEQLMRLQKRHHIIVEVSEVR